MIFEYADASTPRVIGKGELRVAGVLLFCLLWIPNVVFGVLFITTLVTQHSPGIHIIQIVAVCCGLVLALESCVFLLGSCGGVGEVILRLHVLARCLLHDIPQIVLACIILSEDGAQAWPILALIFSVLCFVWTIVYMRGFARSMCLSCLAPPGTPTQQVGGVVSPAPYIPPTPPPGINYHIGTPPHYHIQHQTLTPQQNQPQIQHNTAIVTQPHTQPLPTQHQQQQSNAGVSTVNQNQYNSSANNNNGNPSNHHNNTMFGTPNQIANPSTVVQGGGGGGGSMFGTESQRPSGYARLQDGEAGPSGWSNGPTSPIAFSSLEGGGGGGTQLLTAMPLPQTQTQQLHTPNNNNNSYMNQSNQLQTPSHSQPPPHTPSQGVSPLLAALGGVTPTPSQQRRPAPGDDGNVRFSSSGHMLMSL